LTDAEAKRIIVESKALLEGHFLLSSGRHSPNYLQCALILKDPVNARQVGRGIAEKWADERIDLVIGPALGGIVVAFVVADALGVPAIFAERADGDMTLRRGFEIEPGARVLVAEDVITTGGSALETARLVESMGGVVVGIASIVDRSDGRDMGCRFRSLLKVDFPTYAPEECPLCKQGSRPVKPGSRNL